jgi:hypothetical protein
MDRRDFLTAVAGTAAAAAAGACRRRPSYGRPWDDILARMPAAAAGRLEQSEHEVQLLYTRIDRDAGQRATLTRHPLRIARERWFTAASWVKLPAVLLTAERLTALGADLDARIALDAPPATGNWDAGEPLDEAFRRTARRLLTVSENGPFNRLYEYLGQRELGEGLRAHGYPDVRLIARLGSGDAERNRAVGATRLLDPSGAELERRAARRNPEAPAFPFGQVLKGTGWQSDDGRVVPGAHDFSRTNFIPLESMHDMLAALVFPDAAPPAQRWAIAPAMRDGLLTELARWPRESTDPVYAAPEHYDGFAKYFVVGDTNTDAPARLRLFSKSGQAYGYLQDCAYVVDREAGVEFLLAATIHANADGIFNDDKYEYDEISIPFLASLGRAVLDYERGRPRQVRPTFVDLPDAW